MVFYGPLDVVPQFSSKKVIRFYINIFCNTYIYFDHFKKVTYTDTIHTLTHVIYFINRDQLLKA